MSPHYSGKGVRMGEACARHPEMWKHENVPPIGNHKYWKRMHYTNEVGACEWGDVGGEEEGELVMTK